MNTTPLVFHPNGRSLVEHLVDQGFEVWTINLRGQGDTRSVGGRRNVGFDKLALVDLASAIDAVLARTTTGHDRLNAIGCSLGGTFLFAYLAHRLDHRIAAMAGLGAPISWPKMNPVLRLAIAPRLIGMLRLAGTRASARRLLPVAQRFPSLLSVYMNTAHVDLTFADRLIDTVEDPIPRLNREIAQWMKSGTLMVRGIDVAAATKRLKIPLLAIYGNRDGIVPPAAAAALGHLAPARTTLLEVGDQTTWYAHTDLFVGRTSETRVFDPLSKWLTALSRFPETH